MPLIRNLEEKKKKEPNFRMTFMGISLIAFEFKIFCPFFFFLSIQVLYWKITTFMHVHKCEWIPTSDLYMSGEKQRILPKGQNITYLKIIYDIIHKIFIYFIKIGGTMHGCLLSFLVSSATRIKFHK